VVWNLDKDTRGREAWLKIWLTVDFYWHEKVTRINTRAYQR
jgi:hypothetical protein